MNIDSTKKSPDLREEAKAIAGHSLGLDVIKFLVEDKKHSAKESKEIDRIKSKYKGSLYRRIVFELTHITINDEKNAKELCEQIAVHEKHLSKLLGRNVGIEVAALDFIKNVSGIKNHFSIIEKSKMKTIAKHAIEDDKTKTFSFPLIYSDIDKEIERTNRYGRNFSLLFLDIDGFKRINDSYGHQFGDRALVEISDLIGSSIRKVDTIYRYGGDEFVVLLPESGSAEASQIALKIRKIMKTRKKPDDSVIGNITLSMGIASYGEHDIDNAEKLLASADKAVYMAKRTGKDKICKYKGNDIVEVRENRVKHLKKRRRQIYHGVTIVPGILKGILIKYEDMLMNDYEPRSIEEKDLKKELERIDKAFEDTYTNLEKLQESLNGEINDEHLNIIHAHKLMLRDSEFIEKIKSELREKKINSEAVVKKIFNDLEKKFNTFTSPQFKSKAKDIADIGSKILNNLMNIKSHSFEHLPENSVVFARRILPSDIIHAKKNSLKGLITREGSEYSHAGILAKAFNIPFVTNIDAEFIDLRNGSEVILKAPPGKIILNPNEKDKQILSKHAETAATIPEKYFNSKNLRIGGETIHISANIESKEDIYYAKKYASDGIGLTRLEYVYLLHNRKPTLRQLISFMNDMFMPLGKESITIRLLDMGGDKLLPYMDYNDSDLSKLGTMGVRYLFKHKKLLTDQIMACLEMNRNHKIRMLLPMITFPEEIIRIKEIIEQIIRFEKKAHYESPEIGAMIELPSAVFLLSDIVKEVDFISIGSNDLVQYTMAADREDSRVSDYFKRGNTVIIDIVKSIVDIAKKAGIECELCGELAGNTKYTKKLLRSGLRNFSVSPHLIPPLRKEIDSIVSNQ
ncbi:MAG: phosphoenolpyruvate--protein phosphotransferase [Spirochaetales bacterium]|nr:phosphoenolpyruvate--protein phosphotransferase [Spirochaetales bacterium]